MSPTFSRFCIFPSLFSAYGAPAADRGSCRRRAEPTATYSGHAGRRPVVSGAVALADRLTDPVWRTIIFDVRRMRKEHSPWCIMHGIVGFGVDATLLADDRRMNAISWLCTNQPCQNVQLMHVTNGNLQLRSGPGYQGHDGQLLCVLALSRVPSDYPLRCRSARIHGCAICSNWNKHVSTGNRVELQAGWVGVLPGHGNRMAECQWGDLGPSRKSSAKNWLNRLTESPVGEPIG